MQAGSTGRQGEGIETQQAAFRCILSLVLPPCAVTGGPEEKGVGVWEKGGSGCAVRGAPRPNRCCCCCMERTAAGLPLLPLPALPALPLAIDLVQAIIRVLGPCPERAFSAVDFVADAIVTLQYRRPQCSTPRGERIFWANYGPVLGQFRADAGVENNGSRGHHRESSTAFHVQSTCTCPCRLPDGRCSHPNGRSCPTNKACPPCHPRRHRQSPDGNKMFSSPTHPATHTTPDGDGRFVETDLAVQTSKALKPPASPARTKTNANHEEG